MTQEPGEKRLAPPDPEERRRYLRMRKEAKLTCRVLSEPLEEEQAVTRNLGTGGLLLSTHKPLKVGSRLQICASVSPGNVQLKTGARVVWSDYNGATDRYEAGICFMGLDPDQQRNVLALVGRRLPEGAGMERRRYIRLNKRLLLEYRCGTKLLHRWRVASMQNISMAGVALLPPEHISDGSSIQMRIHLDDELEKTLDAQGVVLHCEGRKKDADWRAHVKFEKLAGDARDRLAGYISRMLTAPSTRNITEPGQ